MADELNNKPEFIVHKRQQDVTPASSTVSSSGEKKRVVVVKKKTQPAQNATAQKTQAEQSKKNVHLVVKRVESQPQPTKNTAADEKASAEQQENKVQQVKNAENGSNAVASHAANNTAGSTEKKNHQVQSTQQPKTEQKNRTFELNPSRPNVKAGNLSDRGRQNQRNNGGYNNRNQNGGNGRPYNRDGSGSNFTGAQARQGYQNRERDSNGPNRQNGYNNRQGQNRQGGNGNFQNRQGGNNGNPRFNNFNNNGGNFRPRQNNSDMGMAAPLPVDNSRQLSNKKAAYKGKKQIYNRKDEEQFDDKFFEQKKKVETPASAVPKEIEIMESVSISDLARKMNLKASEII